jgi:predicted dehydrogenase
VAEPGLTEPGLTEPAIWRAFAEACRGEAPAPAVPFESVLPTMALLDAARESSRSGTVVIPDASIRWAV